VNKENEISWHLLAVMPNLQLQSGFELDGVAFVLSSDPRLARIRAENKAARKLLDAVSDTGGRKMRCAAVIGTCRSGELVRSWDAIVDARNCLALAVALNGWQHSIGQPNNFLVRYTDYFDFFPRQPSRTGEMLLYSGPALGLATTVENKLVAQGHAYILPAGGIMSRPQPDESLLARLAAVWRRVHVTLRPRRYDLRLLRSLSLAYEGARVPQAMENPLYDHGKHCSFWVSAFETLAHPGRGDANLTTVLDLIGMRPLGDRRVAKPHQTRLGRSKQHRALTLPQRLYVRLYNARNRFLHGNRLSIRTFIPRGLAEGVRLLDVAPVVYIAALDAVLGLPRGRISQNRDPSARRIAAIFAIMSHNTLERAFMRAKGWLKS
jgi:hypothetical protein